MTGASAACRSSSLTASSTVFFTVSVSLRSARSAIHLSRFSGASARRAISSIAVGAPCFFTALIATEQPFALSSRKPIIVS